MRTKHSKTVKQTNVHIMYIMSLLGTVGLISIISLGYHNSTSALTYQTSVTNSFTIEPSVSISLSSSELTIDNLTPNSSKESNVLTITAESNSGGYTLYSTVGGSLENTTYASTDLQHKTNYDSSNDNTRFVNLASEVDYAKDGTNLTSGTWGYTFTTSADSDDAWEKFSGLPLNGSGDMAKLIDTDSPSTAAVKFKIAAAAADAQISGEYNNVINFIASPEYTPSTPAATYMQNWTGCSSMAVGDTTTLVDSRDETEYLVGKLADEKCWMLDNLALNLLDSNVQANLNTETTNVTSNDTITHLLSGGGTTSDKYPTSGLIAWPSSNSYSVPMIKTGYETNTYSSDSFSDEAKTWRYGTYYNYCAASAGSYCYGNGTSQGTSSDNATESICPKGWRMPGGGSTINLTTIPPTGEFLNLGSAITGTTSVNYTDDSYTTYRTALHLPLSGYLYNGSASDQGSNGYFWSSTRGNNDYMYSMDQSARNIGPANYDFGNRLFGYSLRCTIDS